LLPIKERLHGYFGSNSWCTLPKNAEGDEECSSILHKYTGNGEIKAIFDLPVKQAVDTILELRTLLSRPDRISSYARNWCTGDLNKVAYLLTMGLPEHISA